MNPGGGAVGCPAKPKALPLKPGPPLLRSMVGPLELHRPAALVVAAAQLLLLEFTCTLLVGPPTILTTVLPLC